MSPSLFPKVNRPGEYIAFFYFVVPTQEGPGYVYMACDAFSEFGFTMGVDKDDSDETILKNIYLLTEHKDFLKLRDKGFTLVLDRFEDLSGRIEAIVRGVNGKILFNKTFHKKIAAPLVDSFSKFSRR